MSISKLNFENVFRIIYKKEIILVFAIIIFVFSLIFSPFNPDNVKSILNVVIQSLASILAIIVSLTLVAVQLSSQNYTPRIVKMYVSYRNYHFWGLITLYLFSIIYSIFILNTVNITALTFLNLFLANLSIFLVVLCLMLIPTYILDTLERLGPERIIEDLSEKLKEIPVTDLDNLSADKNYMASLTDIICEAIKKGHTDTAELGLIKIKDYFESLSNGKFITNENGKSILTYFLYRYVKRVQKTAIEYSDIENTELIIESVGIVGFSIIDKVPDSDGLLIEYFQKTSKEILSTEYEPVISKLTYFEEIFIQHLIKMSVNTPEDAFRIRDILKSIGNLNYMWKNSVERSRPTNILETRLNNIIRVMANEGLLIPINSEIDFLRKFGVWAVKNDPIVFYSIIKILRTIYLNLYSSGFKKSLTISSDTWNQKSYFKHIICNLMKTLRDIGLESVKMNTYEFKDYSIYYTLHYGKIILLISSYLGEIASSTINEKDSFNEWDVNTILDYAVFFLKKIGLELADKKSCNILEVTMDIYSIGMMPKTENEALLLEIVTSLNEIEMKIIETKFKDSKSPCTKFLENIAIYGLKKDFKELIRVSKESLAGLSLELISNKMMDNLESIINNIEIISSVAIFEKESEINVLSFASIIRNIAKKLDEENFGELYLKKALDSLNLIQKKLMEENMDHLAKEIEKWLNEFDDRPVSFGLVA